MQNSNSNQWVVTQANTGDNFTPVVIGTYATEQLAKEAADKLHTEMCEQVDEANPNGGGILPYAFAVWFYLDYHNTHCEQGEEITIYQLYDKTNPFFQYFYTDENWNEFKNITALINRDYCDTDRILVNIQSDFCERTANDYCVCGAHGRIYDDLMSTDDYSDLGSVFEAKSFKWSLV